MKINVADLHIHSRYSDGSYRPGEIFRIAKKHGFKAISITDHDCIDVFTEARELSRNYGIEFIPGAELSSEWNEYDIHILGYFIDGSDPNLRSRLREFAESRVERAIKMIELMNKDGINITYAEVEKLSGDGTVARPHIAQILMDKGYTYSLQEAFEKYLGTNTKYYVKKYKITPAEAISLIHRSGGLAFLAHPFFLKNDLSMLDLFIKDGIDGIETIHSSYDEDFLRFCDKLADEKKLLKSGGSDCHGKRKMGKKLLGNYFVPYSYIEEMKKKLGGKLK
jgi:3',5'-nucleoside bisphosphate phosphatase